MSGGRLGREWSTRTVGVQRGNGRCGCIASTRARKRLMSAAASCRVRQPLSTVVPFGKAG